MVIPAQAENCGHFATGPQRICRQLPTALLPTYDQNPCVLLVSGAARLLLSVAGVLFYDPIPYLTHRKQLMREISRIGAQCRALYNVVTTKGLVRQDTRGTITEEETNLLGHPRLQVDWENGVSAAVPPYAVEVFKESSTS